VARYFQVKYSNCFFGKYERVIQSFMTNYKDENVMDASQNDTTETPIAFLQKEFNRNRKIVLKNVPGITVEVMKCKGMPKIRPTCPVTGLARRKIRPTPILTAVVSVYDRSDTQRCGLTKLCTVEVSPCQLPFICYINALRRRDRACTMDVSARHVARF